MESGVVFFVAVGCIVFFLLFLWEHRKRKRAERQLVEESHCRRQAEEKLAFVRESTEEKIALLQQTQKEMAQQFEALCAQALRKNSSSFLELAATHFSTWEERASGNLRLREQAVKQLVDPLRETLKQVDEKMGDLEKQRSMAYVGLTEQVKALLETQKELRQETSFLSHALRSSSFRGRWGEMQLRRVLELAGMLEHCDFSEQASLSSESQLLRPDVVIHLPNERVLIIDAKTPLKSYLEALETSDPQLQEEKKLAHARHVRRHIGHLSSKNYWKQLTHSPEFVLCFIPGEPFFRTALEADPSLIEYGLERRVILATPITLLSLLLTLAHGWREVKMMKNAEEICDLGRTLYERLEIVLEHFQEVQKGISRAAEAYDKTLRSIDTRLKPTIDRFQELGMGKKGNELVKSNSDS